MAKAKIELIVGIDNYLPIQALCVGSSDKSQQVNVHSLVIQLQSCPIVLRVLWNQFQVVLSLAIRTKYPKKVVRIIIKLPFLQETIAIYLVRSHRDRKNLHQVVQREAVRIGQDRTSLNFRHQQVTHYLANYKLLQFIGSMHGNQRTLNQKAAIPRQNFSSTSPKKITIYQAPLGRRSNIQTEQPLFQSIEQQPSKTRRSISSSCKIHQDSYEIYMAHIVKELTEKKEKLQSCIKFFNLMQSQNAQLRCLTHANVLTIYCQTERRALCANCVYGVARHRTHKLVPLKDAQEFIIEDNALLWKIIEGDLKQMDVSIRNSQESTILLEKQMKNLVRKIEEEYTEKADELKAKYAVKKKRIQKSFEDLINSSRGVEREIEQFKFKVWQTVSKLGIGKRSESGSNNDIQVSRQVLCVNMTEITKISFRQITSRDIDKIFHQLSKV